MLCWAKVMKHSPSASTNPIPTAKTHRRNQTPEINETARKTSAIISPTVVKEARAQFGCNLIPGAFLENEGGQGSANAHWEYRWFQGELMVATNLFAVGGRSDDNAFSGGGEREGGCRAVLRDHCSCLAHLSSCHQTLINHTCVQSFIFVFSPRRTASPPP